MSARAPSPCSVPGCPTIVHGMTKCTRHGGTTTTRTGRPRGSTRKWRRLRAAVLARDGHRCVRCGAKASEVHHRIAAVHGGKDRIDNLESRCADCHRAAHAPGGRPAETERQDIAPKALAIWPHARAGEAR